MQGHSWSIVSMGAIKVYFYLPGDDIGHVAGSGFMTFPTMYIARPFFAPVGRVPTRPTRPASATRSRTPMAQRPQPDPGR